MSEVAEKRKPVFSEVVRLRVAMAIFALLFVGAAIGGGAANDANLQTVSLQALSLLMVGIFLVVVPDYEWSPRSGLIILGISVPAFIGLVQLIPLPAALWSSLPGRAEILDGFSAIGVAPPALPISLAPSQTLGGVFRFMPPIAAAVMTAALCMSRRGSKSIILTLIVISVITAILGVAQAIGPASSPMYLYDITNYGYGVGVFANANHQGTFVLAAMPFVAAYFGADLRASISIQTLGFGIAMTTLFLGVLFAGSMASYILLPPVLLSVWMIVRTGDIGALGIPKGLAPILIFVGLLVIGGAAVFAVITSPLVNGVGEFSLGTGSEVGRPTIYARTFEAIKNSMPIGTGLGSFQDFYALFEDPSRITSVFANHAHNDYLEFILEFGLLGVLFLAAVILFWGRRTAEVWSREPVRGERMRRAASVALGVGIVHSAIDYPLRTAMWACFAAVAAILLFRDDAVSKTETKNVFGAFDS